METRARIAEVVMELMLEGHSTYDIARALLQEADVAIDMFAGKEAE